MDKSKICRIKNCLKLVHCKSVCSYHYEKIRYNKLKKYNPEYLRDKQRKHYQTLSHRYWKAKADANTRGIVWEIPQEEFNIHIKQNKCYYGDHSLEKTGSGYDRIDHSKGYFLDNVVSCCKNCNFTRGNRYTVEEFKIMMDALNEYRKKL